MRVPAGKNIYTVGELLSHDIINALKDTDKQWLVDLLYAFNSGMRRSVQGTAARNPVVSCHPAVPQRTRRARAADPWRDKEVSLARRRLNIPQFGRARASAFPSCTQATLAGSRR